MEHRGKGKGQLKADKKLLFQGWKIIVALCQNTNKIYCALIPYFFQMHNSNDVLIRERSSSA